MSKSKSRKFADILSGNLATILDDGIISASEVASLGTAATTDATAYATAAQGTTADNALPKAGGAMTGAITTNSTFDGRDIATDGAKLDGIETGATADQTSAQILTSIKTVDGASSGLDADLLDGQHGSYYTNYADTAVANLADSAPATLNTLNELAAALGDDASFSTTVTNSIATKLPLAGGTMTGDIAHTGNFTFDIAGYLDFDVDDGGSVYFSDGGVTFGRIYGTDSNLYIKSNRSEKDIIFQGVDGGTAMTALTLDMSNAGRAIFNENIVVSGTVDGRDVATDGTKLDTIETNATADQTDAEIRAAVEAATDSNVFTDADHSKLNAIEASADVTDTANVVSALTAGTNIAIAANGTISSTDTNTTYSVQDGELSQNNFTDADHTKLNSIETNADVTDTTNVVAALTAGTNVAIAANGTISSTDTNTTYSVGDGGLTQKNFTTTLKSKLDGIESGATADQSASEISGLEEFVEDQIGANIIGGTNVSVSYNDSTGQTTLSSTDTNTTYSAGGGLGLSGTTFSHTDTSSQASVNNSGRTYIQDITLDTYGHITAISSATETVVNTDTNTTYNVGGGLTQSGTTFYHADTSSQGSINNSGSNFIQDITVDTYGHITGITSAAAGGDTTATPTLSGATNANLFSGYTVTVSNHSSYTNPVYFYQVVNSGGDSMTSGIFSSSSVAIPASFFALTTHTIYVWAMESGSALSTVASKSLSETTGFTGRYFWVAEVIGYRLRSTQTTHGSVGEIDIYSESGGTGTNYTITGTAESASYDTNYNHTKANDNNVSSMWWTLGNSSPQWLRVDLGQNREVRSIVITNYGNSDAYGFDSAQLRGGTSSDIANSELLFNNISTDGAGPFTFG